MLFLPAALVDQRAGPLFDGGGLQVFLNSQHGIDDSGKDICLNVTLPAVLGIQAAEQPPRYVAISKIRQAMKTASIDEMAVGDLDESGAPAVDRMYQPETGDRAEMLDGDEDEIAEQIIEILQNEGLL